MAASREARGLSGEFADIAETVAKPSCNVSYVLRHGGRRVKTYKHTRARNIPAERHATPDVLSARQAQISMTFATPGGERGSASARLSFAAKRGGRSKSAPSAAPAFASPRFSTSSCS